MIAFIGGAIFGAAVALVFVIAYLRLSRDRRVQQRQRYVNPRNIHRLHSIEHDDDEFVRVFWSADGRSN